MSSKKLEELSEEELIKELSKQYSFEGCFFPNHTFNISCGPQLRKGVFEDSWALSLTDTPKWRSLLQIVDKRVSLQETFEEAEVIDPLITLDFLMKEKTTNEIYSLPVPNTLKFLLKKNTK